MPTWCRRSCSSLPFSNSALRARPSAALLSSSCCLSSSSSARCLGGGGGERSAGWGSGGGPRHPGPLPVAPGCLLAQPLLFLGHLAVEPPSLLLQGPLLLLHVLLEAEGRESLSGGRPPRAAGQPRPGTGTPPSSTGLQGGRVPRPPRLRSASSRPPRPTHRCWARSRSCWPSASFSRSRCSRSSSTWRP